MRSDRKLVRILAALIVLLPLIVPATARAWWKDDWKQRTVITLNPHQPACPSRTR